MPWKIRLKKIYSEMDDCCVTSDSRVPLLVAIPRQFIFSTFYDALGICVFLFCLNGW